MTDSDLRFVLKRSAPGLGSLEIVLGKTKIEFSDASRQPLVEPTDVIAGINVAGLGDLLAMKLSAITKRKVLRDYEDLRAIEELGGRRVEEGLALLADRYDIRDEAAFVAVAEALGAVAKCPDDPLVPTTKSALDAYWEGRLPEVVVALSRWNVAMPSREVAAAALALPPSSAGVPEIDDLIGTIEGPARDPSHGPTATDTSARPAATRRPDGRTVRCRGRNRNGSRCRNELLPGSQCPAHGWRAPS